MFKRTVLTILCTLLISVTSSVPTLLPRATETFSLYAYGNSGIGGLSVYYADGEMCRGTTLLNSSKFDRTGLAYIGGKLTNASQIASVQCECSWRLFVSKYNLLT